MEKQKDFVNKRREAIEEEQAEHEATHPRQEQQQGIQLLDNAEVEFNEQLIEEREQEIQGIEQGIIELNEIFRDLGSIVTEQGSLIGIKLDPPFQRSTDETRQYRGKCRKHGSKYQGCQQRTHVGEPISERRPQEGLLSYAYTLRHSYHRSSCCIVPFVSLLNS